MDMGVLKLLTAGWSYFNNMNSFPINHVIHHAFLNVNKDVNRYEDFAGFMLPCYFTHCMSKIPNSDKLHRGRDLSF